MAAQHGCTLLLSLALLLPTVTGAEVTLSVSLACSNNIQVYNSSLMPWYNFKEWIIAYYGGQLGSRKSSHLMS